ncbi:MAG: zeta toxin family protein [Candidatus Microsaccharimonas sp.]
MKPLTPTTPHAIIMVGIPGSGKTTFAERFAHTFQAPIINLRAIARMTDVADDAAQTLSLHLLDELMKTSRSLIYEGATHSKVNRQMLAKKVSQAGYQPLFVWVQTESIESKRRATKRQKDDSQLSNDEFDAAIKRFTPPSINEKAIVISGKHTYASQLKIVLKHIASHQRPNLAIDQPAPRVRSRNIILR